VWFFPLCHALVSNSGGVTKYLKQKTCDRISDLADKYWEFDEKVFKPSMQKDDFFFYSPPPQHRRKASRDESKIMNISAPVAVSGTLNIPTRPLPRPIIGVVEEPEQKLGTSQRSAYDRTYIQAPTTQRKYLKIGDNCGDPERALQIKSQARRKNAVMLDKPEPAKVRSDISSSKQEMVDVQHSTKKQGNWWKENVVDKPITDDTSSGSIYIYDLYKSYYARTPDIYANLHESASWKIDTSCNATPITFSGDKQLVAPVSWVSSRSPSPSSSDNEKPSVPLVLISKEDGSNMRWSESSRV